MGSAKDVSGRAVGLDRRSEVDQELPQLPPGWVDSGVAAPAAEAASDDFRNKYMGAEVSSRLTRGISPRNPERLPWVFEFRAVQEGEILVRILVDGFTGLVTTRSADLELPESVALVESYPNPSNGLTSIRYSVGKAGTVEVVVMNALGQPIRHLVNRTVPDGLYTTIWDGADDAGQPVAAGSYWCRMSSDRGVWTVSMAVVK